MRFLKSGLLVIFFCIGAFAQADAARVKAIADQIFAGYNSRDYASISKNFNAQMRAALNDENLKKSLDDTHNQLGPMLKMGPPRFVSARAAVFVVDFQAIKLELTVAIDDEGKLSGFTMSPPKSETPRNTSRNKTPLSLPFKGEWMIFWGGDTVAQNYHQDHATQRFAFDILKVDESGKTHRGDGTKNEDYYAFGQEILADADGVVTDVITGIKDNIPGVMAPLMAVGNMVMIRHANGEVSVFCHLKYESTRVKVGQTVKKGDVLGLCGNTGNSSEAHLHYQIQGSSLFTDENSMKVFFEKIMVKRNGKGEVMTEYSPVKGDLLSQP